MSLHIECQDDVFQETKCHCAESGGAYNCVWPVLYRADQGVYAHYGEWQEKACCCQNRGGECFSIHFSSVFLFFFLLLFHFTVSLRLPSLACAKWCANMFAKDFKHLKI